MTGGKSYLVAVAGIACRSGGGDLSGRKLALDGLFNRQQRIGSAGDSHSLVNIGTSGKRIADSAAEACRSTAERLDLGRVIVRFVLEHEEPVLVLAVNVYLDANGACVYLLALVKVLQNTVLLELLRGEGGNIHQAEGLVVPAELVAVSLVFSVCISNVGGLDIGVVDDGAECGVAAVVGPVGVYHADLGDSRVAVLALEIILTELDIVVVHCQTVMYDKIRKLCIGLADESGQRFNGGGDSVLHFQSVVLVESALTGLNGVDEIVLDACELIIGDLSLEDVNLRVLHYRTLAGTEHLNALCSGIRALVELTRQELNGEHSLVRSQLRQVIENLVNRRLGEHCRDSRLEVLFGQLLAVVAVDNAHILN